MIKDLNLIMSLHLQLRLLGLLPALPPLQGLLRVLQVLLELLRVLLELLRVLLELLGVLLPQLPMLLPVPGQVEDPLRRPAHR